MEWDLEKYNTDRQPQRGTRNERTVRPASGTRPASGVRSAAPAARYDADSQGSGLPETRARAPRTRQRKRRLPPWVLVLVSLLFYCFFFHIWTENHFSVGRFLTLTALSLSFALIGALLATIGKKWKVHKIIALVIVIFWAVVFLTEYFLLDSFQNFFTPAAIFDNAGNAGQEDFARNTVNLVLKNLWRVFLFAVPIAAWALANRFLRVPRIRTKGMRRYLAAAGLALFLIGLFFGGLISPDRKKMGKEYTFDDAVHSFGLPMAFALETFKGGSGGGEFEIDDSEFVPFDPNKPADTTAKTEPAPSLPPETDSDGNTVEPSTTEPTPPATEPTYAMLDLDFQKIIDSSSSDTAVSISKYLATLTPSKTNEMTGMFKGKNLILICAEAFSKEVITEEHMPTLYRMMTQGIEFTDFYQPAWGGSTSSGEFSVLTGIEPAKGASSIKQTIGRNMDVTIGNLLQAQGYFSRAYHNHTYDYYSRDKTHENMGYEKYIGYGNGMEKGVTKCWPESDKEMFDYSVPLYIDQQPFSIYYMTVSGHGLYSWMGNTQSSHHREEVNTWPELQNASETVKAYYACNYEMELAMESLVSQLEAAGIADDTLVVICADHYPYCLEKSDTWQNDKDYLSEYYGDQVDDCFERDHNVLIMWSGCLEGKNIKVTDPCCSLDIVPTLCNLFGVDWDSRLYSGRDVFSDAEPLVFWPNHSWITDKGRWNSAKSTGTEFTPAPGVEVTEEYTTRIRKTVNNKLNYAYSILSMDYFKLILK